MRTKVIAFFLTIATLLTVPVAVASAAVGDGTADDVSNDDVSDVITVVRDHGLEHAPTIVSLIGAVFLVSFTIFLIRMYLAKSKTVLTKGKGM